MKNGIVIESNREYHNDFTALSKSRLANMSKTPAYFKWCIDVPQETSDDLIIGSAFHKFVLERADFEKEFAVLPNVDKRTKAGKIVIEDFMCSKEGKEFINLDSYVMIDQMAYSLFQNPYAERLLDGIHEQSMYFVDEFTGVHCKIRPDCYKVIGDKVIITDLKSCKSAEPTDFMKDIVKYSYDLQAYMYRLGVAKTLGIPIENVSFVFICVEKKAPYLSAIYECTQEIFDRGEMLFRKYIGMYKECCETNNWYGYNGFTHTPMPIGLPDWLIKNEKGE